MTHLGHLNMYPDYLIGLMSNIKIIETFSRSSIN